jgi:type VI secretion system protein ImpH
VKDWLDAQPYAFDFIQAVRLLETFAASGDTAIEPLGTGSEPRREAVRLRADMGFAVTPGEIGSLAHAHNETPPTELTVALGALAGAFGPLPDWVGELVLLRSQRHDHVLRDFLDIFHHRLLSLLYRAAVHHRPWLAPALNDHQLGSADTRASNGMSRHLLAFMGLGLDTLAGRSGIPDAELLPYAGLYWHRPRNIPGLRRILEHAFTEAIVIVPMRGRWLKIAPRDYTRLGARRRAGGSRLAASLNPGRHRTLGRSAALGTQFWNPQGCIELCIGPIPFQTLEQYLPGQPSYRRLQSIVRSYAGELTEVHVHALVCNHGHPGARLGGSRTGLRTGSPSSTARLGYTTLLSSRARAIIGDTNAAKPASLHRVRLKPLASRIA